MALCEAMDDEAEVALPGVGGGGHRDAEVASCGDDIHRCPAHALR